MTIILFLLAVGLAVIIVVIYRAAARNDQQQESLERVLPAIEPPEGWMH
jgi:hypothetical protein